MLRCREAAALVSEAQAHPLPFRRRLALKVHLMMCRACRRFAKQVAFLHRAALRLRKEDPPEHLPPLSPEAARAMALRIREANT